MLCDVPNLNGDSAGAEVVAPNDGLAKMLCGLAGSACVKGAVPNIGLGVDVPLVVGVPPKLNAGFGSVSIGFTSLRPPKGPLDWPIVDPNSGLAGAVVEVAADVNGAAVCPKLKPTGPPVVVAVPSGALAGMPNKPLGCDVVDLGFSAFFATFPNILVEPKTGAAGSEVFVSDGAGFAPKNGEAAGLDSVVVGFAPNMGVEAGFDASDSEMEGLVPNNCADAGLGTSAAGAVGLIPNSAVDGAGAWIVPVAFSSAGFV